MEEGQRQNQGTQNDAVPAEDLEVVLADIGHEPADHDHGHHEGGDHADQQNHDAGCVHVCLHFNDLKPFLHRGAAQGIIQMNPRGSIRE
jgi:hypothetical protein